MKLWKTLVNTNTVAELVNSFNNNANSGEFLDSTMGTMLWNGVLFNGRETVGEKPITPLQSVDLSGVNPEYLLLDNICLYYKNTNSFLNLNMETINLKNYNTGRIQFLFFSQASNGTLAYRVSDTMEQSADELLFARFQLNADYTFNQFYIMAQRVGTNMYNAADEFYYVSDCFIRPSSGLKLGMTSGYVKRSGIEFTDAFTPDIYTVNTNVTVPRDLRYITANNTVDYNTSKIQDVITNKYLNYNTNTLLDVPENKYTIQRILWDIYDNSLIMQYGDQIYNNYNQALSGASWLKFPPPFNTKIYIPLAILVLKSGTTDLSNTENIIVVRRDEDVTQPSSANEDSISRAQMQELKRVIEQEIVDRQTGDTNIINGTTPVTKANSLQVGGSDTNYHNGAWYIDYTNATNKPKLDTTQTTSQSLNSAETISGTIKLHKISKTGKFSDILNKPTTIGGYGITDAYTKTQIDNMSDNTFQSKITAGSSAPNANTPGSVYLQYIN